MTLAQLKELAEKSLNTSGTTLEYRSATVPEAVLDLITRVEGLSEALKLCGHNPLVPKGTWPTSEEIYYDRAQRVEIAQKALAQYGADKDLG